MTTEAQTNTPQRSLAAQIEQLWRYEGPPERFLEEMIRWQCGVGPAEAAAILRHDDEEGAAVLAAHPEAPPDKTPPLWLAQAGQLTAEVLDSGATRTVPLAQEHELYGQHPQRYLVMIPLQSAAGVRGAAAFVVLASEGLAGVQQRLELSVSLLPGYELRLTLQQRREDLERLRGAMQTAAAVNEQARFRAAAMALCNEAASRWSAERVSLGMLRGRYVKMQAMSHTEKFTRKMKLVQDIESAMEECLDQDVEVFFPRSPEATFVARAAEELCTRHGPSCALSLPLRRGGEPRAVLTVELPPDRPPTLQDVQALRLACELSTARLIDLREQDQWFGARLARGLRKTAAAAVGPRHTWAKLTAVIVLALVLAAAFAKGPYYIEAPFTIQAADKHVVAAPHDGYLASVAVQPGDRVGQGQELARLRTTEDELELARLGAQRAQLLREAEKAQAEDRYIDRQIAEDEAERVWFEMEQARRRIDAAVIRSPIAGAVLKGDLERIATGGPVQRGDVLFEVAPRRKQAVNAAARAEVVDVLVDPLKAVESGQVVMRILPAEAPEPIEIAAPISGTLLPLAEPIAAGDRVEPGRVLLEVSPMRAELAVPERRVAELVALGSGARGRLAPVAFPGTHLGFIVERINPAAQMIEKQNAFAVRATLSGDYPTDLSPGMRGVARIDAGRARYAWMWTRGLVDWVRMQLWW